jgi:O-antigen/teichoic acid export membrane protein
MSLQVKVKSGLKWNLINQLVSQVIFVWFGIYLARILGPNAYGLIGMITVFSGFANLFIDFGFSSAIIYDPKLTAEKTSSVFWFNLFIGVFVYLIFFLVSPLLASFYGVQELSNLTRVVTVSLIFNSLSGVPNSLISKSISFKEKVQAGWISTILSYIIGFILAFKGYGVWSLVTQSLVFSFVNLVLIWRIAKFLPKNHFSLSDIKSLVSYGGGIAGTNLFGYLTRNLDNLLIGKLLGEASLGIYSKSYSLMMLPIKNISSVFTKVLFPAFSKIQNQREKIAFYYLKTTKLIALITFPLMFGLFSVASEFVLIFLGPNWVDAIPIVKMLSLLGAIQSVLTLNGVVYNSLGKSVTAFKVTLILNLVLIPSWIIGIKLNGLNGLALAYLLIGSLGSIPILTKALSYINLTVLNQLKNLFNIIFSSIAIIVSCAVFDLFFSFSLGVNLVYKIIIGSFVYIVLIFLTEKRFLIESYKIMNANDKSS